MTTNTNPNGAPPVRPDTAAHARQRAQGVRHAGLPAQYLTPEDLVRILQLESVQTLYAWRKNGTGPPAARVGKHLRYHPDAVQHWLTQRTETAA